MITKLLFYLALVLLTFTSGLSQSESTILHTDKEFYVTGETIWYKYYLPHAPAGKEAAIKAILLDQSGRIIQSYFCSTHGATFIYGQFEIPFDLPTSWYQLVFSNFDPKSRLENLLIGTYIPIYNDLLPYPPLNTSSLVNNSDVPNSGISLNINLSQEKIRPRQEVEIELILTDSSTMPISGNASITILDKNLNTVFETFHTSHIGVNDAGISYHNVFNFDFETSAREKNNREYIGIFLKEPFKFRYVSSLNNNFTLVLDPFAGEKESQQFFISDFNKPISKTCLSLGPLSSVLPFNPQIQQYLEWSRTRKKTLSIFPAPGPPMIKAISKSELKDMPTPDRSIEVSKYDEFEDVFSFFKELNTPLKFKLDKNKRIIASVYNTEISTELEGKPVFIIDGRVTDRADWIARLPMATIKKVDIFYNTKILLNYFGMIGRSGMIIIQTKTNLNMPDSIAHFENKLNGYIPMKGSFEIKKEQIESRHTPLFKPLVYWNANIELDKKGRASIKFFHSDDIGDFIVKVVAMDNNGNITSSNSKYKVTP